MRASSHATISSLPLPLPASPRAPTSRATKGWLDAFLRDVANALSAPRSRSLLGSLFRGTFETGKLRPSALDGSCRARRPSSAPEPLVLSLSLPFPPTTVKDLESRKRCLRSKTSPQREEGRKPLPAAAGLFEKGKAGESRELERSQSTTDRRPPSPSGARRTFATRRAVGSPQGGLDQELLEEDGSGRVNNCKCVTSRIEFRQTDSSS